ncbi:MAG: proline--tRNA ligase [Candidatus Eremiobacteraeota bacterium]|nr:proline--tRNA ligase [Candidatus Eremiobacteraeota bacterium]
MKETATEFVKEIPSKSENFSDWYTSVILKGELADYSPVRGCMVIRPYGFAIWENIQHHLNLRFRETGHRNAYFPLFIPESFLKKEAEHVEGFAPQVAWVTRGGTEELTEPLVVRPTSEAIICSMYAKWIKSYRDLPVLINQWCNVVRWEKATRLFLRTTEFLWQEGHTAHRTAEEAEAETLQMLTIYREFAENILAIPVLWGKKTEGEKFAGAVHTYTIEALMPDGQALQAGTSHNLGTHFSKAFNIKFLDSDNTEKYVWQTSWGVSTRIMGALIMAHGDDRGLAFPPMVAPTQVVLVPIFYKSRDEVLAKAQQLKSELAKKFRVELDDRDEYKPGWKFNEWEMKGVPLRIELGPRDLEEHKVTLVSRVDHQKTQVPIENLEETVERTLASIQQKFLEKARHHLMSNIFPVESVEQFMAIKDSQRGFYKAAWCGREECSTKIAEATKTTPRCISLEEKTEGPCLQCSQKGSHVIYFARAY